MPKTLSKKSTKKPNSANKVRAVFYIKVEIMEDLNKMSRKERNETVNDILEEGVRRKNMGEFLDEFAKEPGSWSQSEDWLDKFRKKFTFRDLKV